MFQWLMFESNKLTWSDIHVDIEVIQNHIMTFLEITTDQNANSSSIFAYRMLLTNTHIYFSTCTN